MHISSFVVPLLPAPTSHASLSRKFSPTCCATRPKTYLVGAGPGTVDDLTHRAARVLGTASVVVTDALVDASILALAPGARIIHAGKRGGNASSAVQEDISGLLVRLATSETGGVVVRLKAGDVGLFGRADDEITALDAAGVDFEIVPGLTSVSAAAAACRASLTGARRRTVLTLSGHDVAAIDFGLCAAADVVVFLMAGRALAEILDRLVESDGGEVRQVKVVRWAGREDVQVVQAPIGDVVAEVVREMPGGISPAVVIAEKA